MSSILATTSIQHHEMYLSPFAASATSSVVPSLPACSIAHAPREKEIHGRSCLVCQKRKVRCNRDHPCANCVKGCMVCIYPANTKRRPRGLGKKKGDEMRRRVARLEGLLETLGGRVEVSGEKRHVSRLLEKKGQSVYR
jgi:hypothetical protein